MAASELGFAVLGGLALGYWLDGLLGTSPWLLLVGLVLGFTGGLWTLIRLTNKVMEDDRSKPAR
ncbi:MAG: AtpZ/AtpI family protein [Myxococcales bacterium]|nr:AtpZ/AtpI family protein [Myxococcales bacterium]